MFISSTSGLSMRLSFLLITLCRDTSLGNPFGLSLVNLSHLQSLGKSLHLHLFSWELSSVIDGWEIMSPFDCSPLEFEDSLRESFKAGDGLNPESASSEKQNKSQLEKPRTVFLPSVSDSSSPTRNSDFLSF